MNSVVVLSIVQEVHFARINHCIVETADVLALDGEAVESHQDRVVFGCVQLPDAARVRSVEFCSVVRLEGAFNSEWRVINFICF